MSKEKATNKSTKKATTPKPSKPEVKNTFDGMTVTTESGVKKAGGAWATGPDGKTREAKADDILKATSGFITVGADQIGVLETFAVHYKKRDCGGFIFSVETSKTLDAVEIDPPEHFPIAKNGETQKITLVGRGEVEHAVFALTSCFKAIASQFGIDNAYRCVWLELEHTTKQWTALFVEAIEVAR